MIVVHEIGHFLMAKVLNIEVDKIYLYPFGGISKFFLPLNISLSKELIILIAGPLAQELAKIILITIFSKYENIIIMYHYGILLFNLLPVYPLDGGKLINLLLNIVFPFKKSLKLIIYTSYLTIIFYFIINFKTININTIIIVIFLSYKVIKEQKQINYIYEKFMLERYLNNYKFKKSKLIKTPNSFYKNARHIINENNKYYLEKEYLQKKYKKV